MITKIQKIRSIGNFNDYDASGDVTLKKFSLIYAENGVGKTTLATILKSLSLCDERLLLNRRRIDSTKDPLVEIRLEDGTLAKFDSGRWNKRVADLEVFDSIFVADNVYSGMNITLDNRRSLFKFVLGDTGVKIAKKIEKVRELKNMVSLEMDQVNSKILKEAGGKDSEALLKIQKIEDIEKQIEKKNNELNIARTSEIIRNHEELPKINYFTISVDIDRTKALFAKSIDCISEIYIKKVSRQIEDLGKHGIEHPQEWLHEGAKAYNNNDNCPFCGQSLRGARELLEGYNQYFNAEYNGLLRDISEVYNQYKAFNPTNFLSNVKALSEKFLSQYNFWKAYIPNLSEPPALPNSADSLVEVINIIIQTLVKKRSNPLTKVECNELNNLQNISKDLASYITALLSYSTKFQQYIDKIKQSIRDVKTVEKELRDLILIKKRFEEPLSKYCERYSLLLSRSNNLQGISTKLQKQQKEDSANFLMQYGNSINHYLSNVFYTDFKITNVHDAGIRGKAKETSINYDITLHGQSLNFEGDGYLSLKNTLSEGDKNTIAFSLFLSKLDSYPAAELAKKVIVFDDPLSSLDLNRRNSTIMQLVDLSKKCKQLIILSHNLSFLLELNNQKAIKKADKKTLIIEKNSNGSFISEYDLKDELSTNFAKCLEAMERMMRTGREEDKEPAINAIRLSLEAYLKFKYSRYLKSVMNDTFGKVITTLESDPNCQFVDGTDKSEIISNLKELCDISWRTHHASVEELGERSEIHITKSELTNKYIPLTLDLLFGKL